MGHECERQQWSSLFHLLTAQSASNQIGFSVFGFVLTPTVLMRAAYLFAALLYYLLSNRFFAPE
jgi:hypothetical protein